MTCFKALKWLKQPQSRCDHGRSRSRTIPLMDLDFQRLFTLSNPSGQGEEEEGQEGQGYTCTCNDCADTAQRHRPCLIISLHSLNILRSYFIHFKLLLLARSRLSCH